MIEIKQLEKESLENFISEEGLKVVVSEMPIQRHDKKNIEWVARIYYQGKGHSYGSFQNYDFIDGMGATPNDSIDDLCWNIIGKQLRFKVGEKEQTEMIIQKGLIRNKTEERSRMVPNYHFINIPKLYREKDYNEHLQD